LPQRLLGSIRDALAKSLPIETLCLGVAGWMRYVMGVDEAGAAIEVKDPLAAEFRAVVGRCGQDPAAVVAGLLGIRAIFGDDLPRHAGFRRQLTDTLARLISDGTRNALAAFAETAPNAAVRIQRSDQNQDRA
jgi:fructuronate reductase